MDAQYDRKFEEMKQYIPFLEGMIVKLQDSDSNVNPRQAQLDKIKSLRDLLLNKKKRMKMENLLKCEQVLVNLYTKVQERNSIPETKNEDSSKKANSDLIAVRSKLKSVVSKLEPAETLPEIARASETEEKCVPGSKEPALFQRRPNMTSSTSSRISPNKNKESPMTRRTYTRVLVSPEPSETYPKETSSEKQLYSRRSPKKSPRKRSPPYHRKERKKSLKTKSRYNQSKDLNITLNVPEDSLNSLNTKDILSRIINCSDSDVDIATLRELRTQILGELKDTGENDDISDIILKSYKSKKNNEVKDNTNVTTIIKKSEVEDGELSDSESEAIESIYGSLVVLDKNKSASLGNKTSDKDKPRKIQICLVINSDKTKLTTNKDNDSCVDTSDFETFDKYKDQKINEVGVLDKVSITSEQCHDDIGNVSDVSSNDLLFDTESAESLKLNAGTENPVKIIKADNDEEKRISPINKDVQNKHETQNVDVVKPNFYKPLAELGQEKEISVDKNSKESQELDVGSHLDTIKACNSDGPQDDGDVKIPLLEPTEPVLEPSKEVSEIDILQALKKEILSETTNVLNTDSTGCAISTPLLHQPKISKVANAREIGPKKRISIESYKAKGPVNRFTTDIKSTIKDDTSRKQSLKLTEKECERFNFLSKLTLTESSDDEDKSSLSLDDIYTDLAPKSPDHEDFADTGLKPPVIIPCDPVQARVVGSETDVDMRIPNVTAYDSSTVIPPQSPLSADKPTEVNIEAETSKSEDKVAPPHVDPRMKRDSTSASNTNAINSQSMHVETIQSPMPNFFTSASVSVTQNEEQKVALNLNPNSKRGLLVPPILQSFNITPNVNMSPNIPPLIPNLTSPRIPSLATNLHPAVIPNIPMLMTPSRTPLVANMTPSRTPNMANMTPNMTPSRHTNEDYSNRKHVYAPMFYVGESRENMENLREDQQWDVPESRANIWEDQNSRNLKRDVEYRNIRKDIDYRDSMYQLQRDVDYRGHSVQRDVDYRDIRKNSMNNNHCFDRDSDHIQYPPTPNHPFGRRDCPPTPTPSFGRRDCPQTPTPSFGRLDCPSTSMQFGSRDCPPTPTPSFGRGCDTPMTPIHAFGRSDCPLTPSHPFGRSEPLLPSPNFGGSEYNQSTSRSQDPRLYRSSDYENYQYRDDERERGVFQERQLNSGQYNPENHILRKFSRESVGRGERNNKFESEYRDQIRHRETSIGRSYNREDRDYDRSYNREFENDRYSRSRTKRGRVYDYRNCNDTKSHEDGYRRSYNRERSVGRTQETVANHTEDRKASKLVEENKLRIDRHGGPSFTIDTSINSSFQNISTREKSSFDARRQRASSVGRSLLPTSKTIHETNASLHDAENKIRTAQNFRRACSVGRDVVSSKKLNFKDIKADLRSFKFNSDFRFSKYNSRSGQKVSNIDDKSNSKYSPRKNNRDPRMRRENSRDAECRSRSRESRNYGIVYSNDNISKGTILGSGYGVKNYKIPKIKRPQDLKEFSNKTNDNESCSKNQSLDLKENVLHIKRGIKERKSVNSTDGENDTVSQNVNPNGTQNMKISGQGKIKTDDIKQRSKKEFDETEIDANRNTNITNYDGNKICKSRKPKNSPITKIKDTKESLDDHNIQKQNESEINICNTSTDSIDSIERRVTRSARKSFHNEPMSLELSPLKRTRKVKKSLVLESDSDDNDKTEPSSQQSNLNSEEPQNISRQLLSISDVDNKASSEQSSTKADKENKKCEISTLNVLDSENIALSDIKVSTACEARQEIVENETNVLENTNVDKQELDLTQKTVPVIINDMLNNKDNQIEDDLDSSFGLGDLEMFTDNITADAVVDNINALIADLDHDLDTSKNTDSNSQFTNEISLETMLENITSLDRNDKPETENISSNDQDVISTDKSNKVINFDKSEIVKETDISKEDSISSKQCNKLQKNEVSYGKVESESSKILLSSIKNKTQDSTIASDSAIEKECEISNEQLCVPLVNESKVVEDVCSNDAIVSTSDDGNNLNQLTSSKNLPNSETANSPSTPDSTINCNVEDVEPKNDGNKYGCEMNSDITSTLVSDAPNNDSLDAVSSEAGKSLEIDTILSILKDKTKIKELLSLLDNQSNENEKIKKKLVKLSEIVSDDESAVDNKLLVESKHAKSSDHIIKNNFDKVKPEEELNNKSLNKTQEIKENESSCETSALQKKENDIEKSVIIDKATNVSEDAGQTYQKNFSTVNKTITDNVIMVNNLNKNPNDLVKKSQEDILKEKDDTNKTETAEPGTTNDIEINQQKETHVVKPNTIRKRRRRGKKWYKKKKQIDSEEKRVTRSDPINLQPISLLDKPVTKKPSRELLKLQEDIREMFIKEDILSTTGGIRMCRIAKLVDEKKSKEDVLSNEIAEPLIVLEKCSNFTVTEKMPEMENIRKKKITRTKNKDEGNNLNDESLNTDSSMIEAVSGVDTKSKLKEKKHGISDTYRFETRSLNESNNASDKNESSSESENDSVCSTKSSENAEIVEPKKKVKRRRGRLWQSGVIKPKSRKKKSDQKLVPTTAADDIGAPETRKLPDFTCFTDKSYCFRRHVLTYNCRLCSYTGSDIVHHYKKEHPHTEVPLSRLSPAVANEAIKESEDLNFQGISKISSKKYICRFCSKEFSRKKRLLEAFFWHIVSMHTGEYKQTCPECVDTKICPLDIDIPPPPKDANGQLLGYICEKCNYTQISLENLKTHVIVWHNDEQTAVYTINLANLSKIAKSNLLSHSDSVNSENPRLLRSSRSNQSMAEVSSDESDTTEELDEKVKNKSNPKIKNPVTETLNKTSCIQSKITFESDITDEISNFDTSEATVKFELDSNDKQDTHIYEASSELERKTDEMDGEGKTEKPNEASDSRDIFDYSHFKIKLTESGSKEYVCCINGHDYHYKTSLLISMKKHVQLKHKEKWDGYCCICKVIVTPQGVHQFKDCLQHYLDKHIDDFPILEERIPETGIASENNEVLDTATTNKSYINVRPLSELISQRSASQEEDSGPVLPVIESVVSLGQVDQPLPSPSYPTSITANAETMKQYKYEEFQADIMSKKHVVVLEAMKSQKKLVQVFKCAGRFCSFTTDSAEDALLHASTHMKIGGVDSLNCVYCDYDPSGNAIDLITHVFKYHGCCPYVCGMCFYRAAASQLVNAHIKRLHDKAANVDILKSAFQTPHLQEDNILSREAAVPYYLCCDKNSPEQCKFRTYTSGKFRDHLEFRHAASTEFLCFICSLSAPTPVDLISHLKTHGLKLYQCPWCVFGADDESELLLHASALHPTRQPKAYLRIITNKEGTTELRVLPLAHLNKSLVPAVEVTPNNHKESPVREAERSIELEKLIGHMMESMAITGTTTSETESSIQVETDPDVSFLENIETMQPRVTTPVSSAKTIDQSEHPTPILKAETLKVTPEKISQPEPEIVCLDSDDETPVVTIEITSAPEIPEAQTSSHSNPIEIKQVELTNLFVCYKCKLKFKCASGFRKHVNACFYITTQFIPCAHCPTEIPRKHVVKHYNTHCEKAKETKETQRYSCTICAMDFNNINKVKEHQQIYHSSAPPGSTTSSFVKECTTVPKTRRKRCLDNSRDIDKSVEPPEKVTRYGPQDIDKLPINPILDDFVVCSLCEFNTKVRVNMVRHLLLHAQQQPVAQTAPVNPVPHLETNEKHFDKMVNLASSSIGLRTADKGGKPDANTPVQPTVSPDAISRFPRFVPDKQRLTCGAKGCSYISVDESMLKCHWETLHYGTNDFHCVHCPPYQQLDKTKLLCASRIIAHLKMHDEKLYACSLCSYYHYRRQILEKHLAEVHKGGRVLIVREGKVDSTAATAANASLPKLNAPTMDLKPWQCGLCKFKSMLRQEVVDHCAKVHNSKMQYKCAYCAFRTSNSENITKHQAKSHVDKPEEIFYFYYREGSILDEPDGTTRWQKQSQNMSPTEPKVKSEDSDEMPPSTPPKSHSLLQKLVQAVDLNLVKKEVNSVPDTIEDLCKEFGAFCEPNGLKYKCSLCSNVIEDDLEAMQSHLYEELKYRKWGCSICTYKAFHKEGLTEHMQTEHRQNRDPIALPIDNRVETWVAKLLEHQTTLIAKYKENLAKQKVEILRTAPEPSTSKPQPQVKETLNTEGATTIPDENELSKTFGAFGKPSDLSFCCPKCSSCFKDENHMRNHLESELNKIRWFCSNCPVTFQRYHEAQFHSRTVHSGQGARPVEVTKDATVRAAWLEAVIRTQKLTMDVVAEPIRSEKIFNQIEDMIEPAENSLLVVRYEKKIPTPEEEMARTPPTKDGGDEKLVIDEPLENRKAKPSHKCPHCTYLTNSEKVLNDHILRHYGLKPYNCPYCNLNGTRKTLMKHQKQHHATLPLKLTPTTMPSESPSEYNKKHETNTEPTPVRVVCLVCRNYFTEAEALDHVHDKILTTFGKKGEVVVQCSLCRTLHKDVTAYLRHHKALHAELGINYVFCKLNTMTAESKELLYACAVCPQKFSQLKDIKAHAEANHQSALKYTLVPKHPNISDLEVTEEQESSKRKSDDDSILPPRKRTARKSTTKLPPSRSARKSTTKLPFNIRCETEEFSYYGTKPSAEGLERVVTMMPFCNKMVPFTFSSLKDMISIEPVVMVKKTNAPL